MKHKVLSCIPRQMTDTSEKLDWLRGVSSTDRPHILVTPQEFFGGAVMMPHKRDFRFDELFPELSAISKQYEVALAVGVQQRDDDGSNKTAIWFINENGEYQGRLVKFALPRYDHIDTSGFGHVCPETDIENRFRTFLLYNLNVTALFCWEVYSDILWTGLGILKPDLVLSMIKFGPNAWPKVEKRKGLNTVVDFGYGKWNDVSDDGQWLNRLRIGNVWQAKCPVINSTNGWNLNPRSMPVCGCISGIEGQAEDDHWYPKKADKFRTIPEKIIVSEIDENAVRATMKNRFVYKDLVGDFPPMSLMRFTMHLKMNRVEDRLLKQSSQNKKGLLYK